MTTVALYQNCSRFNNLGSAGAPSGSSASSSSLQSSSTGGTTNQDAAMIAALNSALSPFASQLMSMGISSANLATMTGQSLMGALPSVYASLSGQVSADLQANAATAMTQLSGAQLMGLSTNVQLLYAALQSYSASSLSVNGLALQKADLEILANLNTILASAASGQGAAVTPVPAATPSMAAADATLVRELAPIIAGVESYLRNLEAGVNGQGPYGPYPNSMISTMTGVGLTAGTLTAATIASNQADNCSLWNDEVGFAGLDLIIPPSVRGAAQNAADTALNAAKALPTANLSVNGAALLTSDIFLLNGFRNTTHNYYACTKINFP